MVDETIRVLIEMNGILRTEVKTFNNDEVFVTEFAYRRRENYLLNKCQAGVGLNAIINTI